MQQVHAFRVAAGHPAFDGHFPGRPVLPGVVLLDEVLAAIARETGHIAPCRLGRVKFVSPVVPGEEVAILLAPPTGAGIAFACMVGSRRVLAGSVSFPEPAEPVRP